MDIEKKRKINVTQKTYFKYFVTSQHLTCMKNNVVAISNSLKKKKKIETVLENFMGSEQVPRTQINSTAYNCPYLLEHWKTIVYAQPWKGDERDLH